MRVLAALCLFAALAAAPARGEEGTTMKVRLTLSGKAVEATLLDSASARDFLALLPMTLTLEDYASTEKIAYLPRKLSTTGAPEGIDPSPGDIAYYAPWGNLALFYRDARHAKALVRLGRFDGAIDALQARGALTATIERIPR
jgi:hypothetical protein